MRIRITRCFAWSKMRLDLTEIKALAETCGRAVLRRNCAVSA